ncbi:STAS domain-containing protein [Iamia sp. SCSIO 61187]|uniref:STAS domain-containing protein n=1 Tax=Iamia sp. SCSIO 61187 TaxID=2722752 RepID=UPI001C62EF29|nr:STAS domain-containing protein [Iamia sp. SCSIO 61187]QYG92303.1 STAS domain-containing protein [Iamia sp. SCSIO 61187]
MIDVDRSRLAQGVVVVALSGDVDVFSVPRLRSVLTEHIGTVDVVLDLAGVAFCDSSALRVFVDAQRRAAAGGRTLEIAHPSAPVRNLFDVSGLRGVLRVTTDP